MTGRLVVLVLAVALAAVVAAVVTVGTATGRASSTRAIGVSGDGEHYGARLDAPLFEPSLRWVPGDSREARFWVRNQADGAGDLSIDVLTPGRTGLLETGWLTVAARVGEGEWRVLEDGGTERLLTAEDVASADALPVTVRVAFAAEAPASTEVLATDLDVRVALAGASTDDATSGRAAGTAVPWSVPALALVLLLAGPLVLLARPHRRPRAGGVS